MIAAIQTLQEEAYVSSVVHKPGRELDDPKELLLGAPRSARRRRPGRALGRRPGDTAASLIAALHAAGEQTRAIACAAELTDISTPGGRFRGNDPRPLPTLAWILTYVLQEYARHAGHLDVAREVIDGTTGELPGVAGAPKRADRASGPECAGPTMMR